MIKNRLLLIIAIIMISVMGCEGPVGQQGERGLDGSDGSANVQTFYLSWDENDFVNPPESGFDDFSYVAFEGVNPLTSQMVEEGVVLAHWSPLDGNNVWIALPHTYEASNVVEMTYLYAEEYFEIWFTSLTGDFIDGDQQVGRVKISVIPPSLI
ncbi:MAG: hypothetical protein WEA58_04170 [Balneolaceae bacterium]